MSASAKAVIHGQSLCGNVALVPVDVEKSLAGVKRRKFVNNFSSVLSELNSLWLGFSLKAKFAGALATGEEPGSIIRRERAPQRGIALFGQIKTSAAPSGELLSEPRRNTDGDEVAHT